MLVGGIPAFRLSRPVLRREIASLVDANVTLRCGEALGRDFGLDDLFASGYKAVFLSLGAHRSRRLKLEGEDMAGVYPAILFLKAFNLRGEQLARGRVGVIGGGNSAVDAARVALRQQGVENVKIFYRRAREDMPALAEEVDSALLEGVALEPLVSPVKILARENRLAGMECIRNEPGAPDARGRRRPVPVPGTQFSVDLDTLIVTIGDEPDTDYVSAMGIDVKEDGTVRAETDTLLTNRPGVFAGGDIVSGPNTVVDAIAAGKRAAAMIGRHLRGEAMRVSADVKLPRVYVEPWTSRTGERVQDRRAEPPVLPVELRAHGFSEVELPLSEADAIREARRCLRCDLEFTAPGKPGTDR